MLKSIAICALIVGFGSAYVDIRADFRDYSLTWNGGQFDGAFVSETGKQLLGQLGITSSILGDPTPCNVTSDNAICYQWGEDQKLIIYDNSPCYDIFWETTDPVVKDCYELGSAQWYGSGELRIQRWPIQKQPRTEVAFVTGDTIQAEINYGGVSEPYWLTSDGFALHVTKDTPLFVSLDQGGDGLLCLSAKYETPYKPYPFIPKTNLKYSVCSSSDAKSMHLYAVDRFLGKPRDIPDEKVFRDPIWSTWAKYKTLIDETKLFEYAGSILVYGFNHSQVEIDDNWESCYGSHEFNEKFPDPAGMISILKQQGFRVTLWIHPFINENCFSYTEALPYLVKDADGNPGTTSWWQGTRAGIVDFTNPEARAWWSARIEKLRTDYGIDSFKFDAGETNWLPSNFSFAFTPETVEPNVYSTAYVKEVATFGGMAEVRTGWGNQGEPIFFRMLDKDSNWSYDLGLKSLIPSLLQFSISGYPFVLPDMIGGNGYIFRPGKELFIRWLQANVFMPTIQYSYVPWDYDQETVDICRDFTSLHTTFGDYIVQLAQEAVETGVPINRPIWWLDPNDSTAQQIEDEFLLGDLILAAPIVEQGAEARDIYLPIGEWRDEADPAHPIYSGPIWITGYSAPLNVLPYFIKQ